VQRRGQFSLQHVNTPCIIRISVDAKNHVKRAEHNLARQQDVHEYCDGGYYQDRHTAPDPDADVMPQVVFGCNTDPPYEGF